MPLAGLDSGERGLCTEIDGFFLPSLNHSSHFWTPWEFLAIVLPCGKALLGLMCLGKPLTGEFGGGFEVRKRCGVAAREEGVPSLCLSSSLKLFNLSERRHDINKLHPKVGRSCGEQRGSGQGCLLDQLPAANCFGEEQPPFLFHPAGGGAEEGKHWDFPMSLWGLSLIAPTLSSAQTWLLRPLGELPKASSPSL